MLVAMSDTPSLAGAPAPPLALPTLDGECFDLAALDAAPVLVTFLRHAG
jgi:hypothetical protein